MRERVCAIIMNEGRMLVVRDTKAIDFGAPGGGVEHGETLEQALERELSEELGLVLESCSHIHTFDCMNTVYNIPQRNYVYMATVSGSITAQDDIEEYVWITQDDLTSGERIYYEDEMEHVYPRAFNQMM